MPWTCAYVFDHICAYHGRAPDQDLNAYHCSCVLTLQGILLVCVQAGLTVKGMTSCHYICTFDLKHVATANSDQS